MVGPPFRDQQRAPEEGGVAAGRARGDSGRRKASQVPDRAGGRVGPLSPRILFRVVAIAEAITWTLLLAGMLQKYVFDAGDWGVALGGGVHGFVFLAYVVVVAFVGVNQRWRAGTFVAGFGSAIIPLMTIPFDVWADRSGRLDGWWRREAGDHPADHGIPSRLLRWALARPVLVAVVAVVGIAGVFTALLIIGPPGGRST